MAVLDLRLARVRRGERRLLDADGSTWATVAYEPPASTATEFSFTGEVGWSATQTGGFGRFVVGSANESIGVVRYRRGRSLLRGHISWEVTGPDGGGVTTLRGDISGSLSEVVRTVRRRALFTYEADVGGETALTVAVHFRQDPRIVVANSLPDPQLLVTAAVLSILRHPSD